MTNSKHKRQAAHAVSEDDQIARYVYLVDTLPSSVAERAHSAAFAELSAAQRQEVLDGVRPLLSDAERDAASDDPEALAALVRDPEPRDTMMRTGIAGTVASLFVLSAPVAKYFTVGGGSVTVDQQPLWLQELINHESNPIDAGTINHRKGVNSGVWF